MAEQHKCPGCGKLINGMSLYCPDCISASPQRAGYLYRPASRWLKGNRLGTVLPLTTKLMVLAEGQFICLECGVRYDAGAVSPEIYWSCKGSVPKHRCYVHPARHGQVCVCCGSKRRRVDFPIIQHRKYNVRAVVCDSCLAKDVAVVRIEQSRYGPKVA